MSNNKAEATWGPYDRAPVRHRWRRKVGKVLRKYADRIDDYGAPKQPAGLAFQIKSGEGLVVNRDGEGCLLWYLGDDEYEKAFGKES